jgi:peptidoglycan/xylan/chitin deacetylase (PgdA/CDA1 family)
VSLSQGVVRRTLAACVAVTLFAATVALFTARPAHSATSIVVDGRPVALRASVPTVGAALRAAHRTPRDGALLSVGGRVLDAHAFPATVAVGGRPATDSTRLAVGEAVVVVDGTDAVEPVQRLRVPVPPPPLPDVEKSLWHPGRPGAVVGPVGVRSGEVVGPRQQVADPVPPAPETGKVVALTFDDGPNPVWTPQVLKILADEQVKATFCTVGYAIGWDPALAKAEVDQGHMPCDHTAHHVLKLASKHHDQIVQEVNEGADDVKRAIGAEPAFYRAPGGSLSPEVVDVAHQRGLRVLGWTVDPNDYRRPPPPVLLARILTAVQPGSVILLHDGGGDRSATVAILRPLIDTLKARGYTFTTPALEPPVAV